MSKLFKNKDVKVIILEVFLIALGLVGLTLGVKYIMNSINVITCISTSTFYIKGYSKNITSSINVNSAIFYRG